MVSFNHTSSFFLLFFKNVNVCADGAWRKSIKRFPRPDNKLRKDLRTASIACADE